MNKPESKKEDKKQVEPIKVNSFEVSNVKMRGNKDTVYFALTLNGVLIYGCHVVEGVKDKYDDFIAFPSYKGSDGKYYNVVYAPLSDDDVKTILSEVEKQLNK